MWHDYLNDELLIEHDATPDDGGHYDEYADDEDIE
jgi:hypothetical protein